MTREEAKRRMEICRDFLANNYSDMGEPNFTAFNMAIKALSQEPQCTEHPCLGTLCRYYKEPCDEKRDCSTCKYEHNDGHTQPCRDCGTLLESYTNWKQKERELPCIYDLKNRYCPRLNEHGMLIYPQEPCTDAVSREAVKEIINDIRDCISVEGYCAILERLKKLSSVTHKSGKWIYVREDKYSCSKCGTTTRVDEGGIDEKPMYKFCPYCGAKMESGEQTE